MTRKSSAEVQEIAVHVLEDERKRLLAEVAVARLAHGAAGRIGPERLVVGAAIVVAGEAEAGRKGQDQQRRRDGGNEPGRLREPRVRRVAEEQRRIERARDTGRTRSARSGTPPTWRRRESAEDDERAELRHPPRVAPHRLAEPRRLSGVFGAGLAVRWFRKVCCVVVGGWGEGRGRRPPRPAPAPPGRGRTKTRPPPRPALPFLLLPGPPSPPAPPQKKRGLFFVLSSRGGQPRSSHRAAVRLSLP